jgi:FtsZ-binding cell division protein ZapB
MNQKDTIANLRMQNEELTRKCDSLLQQRNQLAARLESLGSGDYAAENHALKHRIKEMEGKYKGLIASYNRERGTPRPPLSPEHAARRAQMADAKAKAIASGQTTLAI